MFEDIVQIENESFEIHGVFHQAANPHLGDSRPCVLLWNFHKDSRVGRNRYQVDLARRLAQANFKVFRFDLPGLGYSSSNKSAETGLASDFEIIANVTETLKQRKTCTNFIIIGHEKSFIKPYHMASRLSDVVGLCCIDSFSPRLKQFKLTLDKNEILNFDKWKTIAKDHIKGERNALKQVSEKNEERKRIIRRYKQDLNTLVRRKMKTLLIYSADTMRSEKQFWSHYKEFDFKDLFQVKVFKTVLEPL